MYLTVSATLRNLSVSMFLFMKLLLPSVLQLFRSIAELPNTAIQKNTYEKEELLELRSTINEITQFIACK